MFFSPPLYSEFVSLLKLLLKQSCSPFLGVTFQVNGVLSFDESNTKIPPGSCLFIYLVTKNKTHQYKSDAVTKLPPSTSPGSLYKFIAYFQRRPEPGAYDLMAVLNFGSCRQNQELKDSIRDGDAVSLDNLGPNFIKSVDNELSNVLLTMQTIYNHLRGKEIYPSCTISIV